MHRERPRAASSSAVSTPSVPTANRASPAPHSITVAQLHIAKQRFPRATSTVTPTSAASSTNDERRSRLLVSSARSFRTRSMTGSSEDHNATDRSLGEEDREMTTKALLSTLEEKLFARLEHHGVRRCVVEPSSAASATARKEGTDDATSASHPSNLTLERCYYYLCVPCDVHLTGVLTGPPTQQDLAAALDHCGRAVHRHYVRHMCIPEMDAALELSPVPDPGMYTTIEINGVRALVSTMPGGNPMFQPDPVESESAFHRVHDSFYNSASGVEAEGAAGGGGGDHSDERSARALKTIHLHTHEGITMHELVRPRKVLQVLQADERAAVAEYISEAGDKSQWSEVKSLYPSKRGHVFLHRPVVQFVDQHAIWVPRPVPSHGRGVREKNRAVRKKSQGHKEAVSSQDERHEGGGCQGEDHHGITRNVRSRRHSTSAYDLREYRPARLRRWIRVPAHLIAASLVNEYQLHQLSITKRREEDDEQAKERRKRGRKKAVPTPYVYARTAGAVAVASTAITAADSFSLPFTGEDRIEVEEDAVLQLTLKTSRKRSRSDYETICRTRHPTITADASSEAVEFSAQPPRRVADAPDTLSQPILTQAALSQLTYSQQQEEDVNMLLARDGEEDAELRFFNLVRNFRHLRRADHGRSRTIQLDLSDEGDIGDDSSLLLSSAGKE